MTRSILGLILCVRALAQTPPCALTGVVVDEIDGKPVAKARVLASGSTYSLWKITDPTGSFCFKSLAPDSYRVTVQKAGYQDAQRRVVVSLDSEPQQLRFEISPFAALSGMVLDSDGDPLAGAEVSLWTRVRESKGFTPNNEENVNSAADGSFRFPKLTPGTYYLGARQDEPLRGFAPSLDSKGNVPREIQTQMFYPGTFTLAEATPLTVKAGGGITNLTFALKKTPARHLSGRLIAAPPNASLVLHARTETSVFGGEVIPIGSDGAFLSDGLPPAHYTLRLKDGGKTIAKQLVDLTAGNAEAVTLDPVETFDLILKIRTQPAGEPFRQEFDGMFLQQENSDESVAGHAETDGSFRFQGVERGIYSSPVRLGNQKLYVKQV